LQFDSVIFKDQMADFACFALNDFKPGELAETEAAASGKIDLK
jgi:hypothetical protein